MKKEEILEKSRKENLKGDERDRFVSNQASSYGTIGMAITFIVLFLIRLLIKGGTGYDLFAMFFSYLAVNSIYKFSLLKEKSALSVAISYALATVISLILYIWKG